MKTPVVTVMRTQGARRRHQEAVQNLKSKQWIDFVCGTLQSILYYPDARQA